MFFYLLKNSSYLKEENESDKNIKILIYGSMCYILLHILLTNSYKDYQSYFWLILSIDCITIYMIINLKKNGNIKINNIKDNESIMNDSDSEVDLIIDEITRKK